MSVKQGVKVNTAREYSEKNCVFCSCFYLEKISAKIT